MYYQMNHSHMAALLAEDVYAPELRNPKISGMSKNRKRSGKRTGNWLSRLLGNK